MSRHAAHIEIPKGTWIEEAATLVWEEARNNPEYAFGRGTYAEAEFNGCPLIAYSTDAHPQVVTTRFVYEQRIRAYKAGHITLEEL